MPRDSYLSIAGITIALHDEHPRWAWEEPISRFLVDPQPSDVTLNVWSGGLQPAGALLGGLK
ncbi:MAG TPA: hypothetical protein VNI54_08160, partial [Thermoanaerobaculia bacterium]|nr:hypothetical protein [Thermoanaerobaculia bacterium]